MRISWEDVDNFVEETSTLIKDEWQVKYKGVYVPPRGGLPLAVMFSHKLDLPLLQSPCKGCLIVDDIADTGETLKKFAGKIDIVTLAFKPGCSYVPTHFKYLKGDDWVIFPWE